MEIALARCTVTNAATDSSAQSAHNVYTNTERDSGIQSELNGILTDLIVRVQQRDLII